MEITYVIDCIYGVNSVVVDGVIMVGVKVNDWSGWDKTGQMCNKGMQTIM